MEMILGVIEDLLETLNGSDSTASEDAKNSLKSNKAQFIGNLEGLDSADAKALLEKLKNLNFD